MGPKMSREGPKELPRGPQTTTIAHKAPLRRRGTGPEGPQGVPRRPPDVPRLAQELPEESLWDIMGHASTLSEAMLSSADSMSSDLFECLYIRQPSLI